MATYTQGNIKSTLVGLGAVYHFNAGNQFSSQFGLSLGMGSGTSIGDYEMTTLTLGYGIKYFVSSDFALMANLLH